MALVISAPFGTYLNWPGAISTLGTFTKERRGGLAYRLWRVLKTVRYYPGIQAWKNQLGLPNPGISSLTEMATGRIISITGFRDKDWSICASVAMSLDPMAVELNISCPNCPGEDTTNIATVFQELRRLWPRATFIVKLPPIGYARIARVALASGIMDFHCCNTIPTPGGGLSGKPLKAISLQAVREVRDLAHDGTIIGGGGVTCRADVDDYLRAGADHVAVGSVCFFPWKWPELKRIALNFPAKGK